MPDEDQQEKPLSPLDKIALERAKLAEERAARATKLSDDRKLAAAERALEDEQALGKLEEEHGPAYVYGEEKCSGQKVAQIKAPNGAVIVKRPHAATYNRFLDSKRSTEDMTSFVQTIVLHPKGRFHAMVEEQPHLLVDCAQAGLALAGLRSQEVSGK